ncbi:thioredoxin family protein [Aspergillus clavatus NRRL 1]|uniref:Thioredoxin, putative n=1 Tax=Aspergillus clavatus (strain ATCC 1007 / CBS 513.65 / DSM 816 / NCTC 3887 / NRRL 1 / QM 1276 / 107) TaxID=344612 RepID=A1CTS2_ASPCL|nr:thioredoxin, putative [Aspergillus clavatus NRRL 1]EAW06709.1 thioredoxin, putative [Aspergillus clavatus NRRL 1]
MEYSRIILALVVYVAIRLIYNRFFAAPATIMSHGKVIEVDNPVVYKALTSSGPVVVDFFATWCGPCKAIAPVVGKLSETYTDVRFIQVDVDKVGSVAQEMNVRAMPTFVLYKDGKPLDKRVVGGNVKELEEMIKSIA